MARKLDKRHAIRKPVGAAPSSPRSRSAQVQRASCATVAAKSCVAECPCARLDLGRKWRNGMLRIAFGEPNCGQPSIEPPSPAAVIVHANAFADDDLEKRIDVATSDDKPCAVRGRNVDRTRAPLQIYCCLQWRHDPAHACDAWRSVRRVRRTVLAEQSHPENRNPFNESHGVRRHATPCIKRARRFPQRPQKTENSSPPSNGSVIVRKPFAGSLMNARYSAYSDR